MKTIVFNTIIFLGIVVGLMIAFVLLRKFVLQKQKERKEKQVKEMYNQIEDKLFSLAPIEFKNHFNNPKQRQYIYSVLKKLVLENGYDFHGIFDEMGFTKEAILKIERNADRQALKDLSVIKSPSSYGYLIQLLQSDDIELSYRAGYAISYISLEPEQKNEIISYLLKSEITAERIVEIIISMDPSLNLLLEKLNDVKTELGKIIILNSMRERVIGNTGRFKFLKKKLRIQNLAVIDQLKKYLNDSEKVAVTTIDVLSDTRHPEALDLIIETMKKRTESAILASIADCLSKFAQENRIMNILYELAKNDDYWVRLASFESLARMGEAGYRKILELSMDNDFLSKYPSTYYLIYQIISQIPDMPKLLETIKSGHKSDFSGENNVS
ncbi:MAG: HEAT repeat domain-containing protein [Caldisericia bacterium]|nr:HEAT repeat domain-containing protein [Caldisericia bacterium]